MLPRPVGPRRRPHGAGPERPWPPDRRTPRGPTGRPAPASGPRRSPSSARRAAARSRRSGRRGRARARRCRPAQPRPAPIRSRRRRRRRRPAERSPVREARRSTRRARQVAASSSGSSVANAGTARSSATPAASGRTPGRRPYPPAAGRTSLLSISNSCESSSARTVAERAGSSASPSSPKDSPRPRTRRVAFVSRGRILLDDLEGPPAHDVERRRPARPGAPRACPWAPSAGATRPARSYNTSSGDVDEDRQGVDELGRLHPPRGLQPEPDPRPAAPTALAHSDRARSSAPRMQRPGDEQRQRDQQDPGPIPPASHSSPTRPPKISRQKKNAV